MILITGGLGYLGVRIATSLVNLGREVKLATSRYDPPVPAELSSCECVRIDFNDIGLLEKACDGVDVIIHLAALNALTSQKDPEAALDVNGLGTLKLLRIAERLPVKKFIYMSTVHVYGSPLQGIIDENCLPRPIHPYSITHRLAEDYTLEANARGHISGVIFRLSNAVGSPSSMIDEAWNLVVNDLCKQVVVNANMQLTSSRYTSRDFLPISSVTDAIINSLNNKKCHGEIFNLSSGVSLTLDELSKVISNRFKQLFDIEPGIHFSDTEVYEAQNKDLLISNRKIKDIGVEIKSDISDEVDKILINCKSWF